MPVHMRHEPDALLLVLEGDGEEPSTRQANGGEQALLYAITMLIDCWRLRVGDRLFVEAGEG